MYSGGVYTLLYEWSVHITVEVECTHYCRSVHITVEVECTHYCSHGTCSYCRSGVYTSL